MSIATGSSALVDAGRRTLRIEAAGIAAAAERLGASFAAAVDLLAQARGRVIVSGVGKSGLIARKIAATFTSTGTPASFLHPVDSLHGDLGIVGQDDVAVLLSKSGASEELFGLIGALQRMQVPIIAIVGRLDSMLAKVATVALDASVAEEACPHDLAPTTSTTVALALGDALAVTLLEVKGFRAEDFAQLHPGGSLGRKLLLRVKDLMLPPQGLLPDTARMRDAVVALARHRGLAMIVREERLHGVLTTGDLARLAEREPQFLDRPAADVMTRTPKTAAPDDLAARAVGTMERHGIMALPVVDGDGRVVGVVHLHDLMRAGAV
ncbi:MAG: KpsF/GutQ family sugar-phosphate isomerase [Gemmatimonadota bacterium]